MERAARVAGTICEARTEYAPALSEADLSAIWAGQLFRRRSLRTEDGAPLRVVYRGLPGAGAGPDFRDAIITGPEGPCHGDIELHLRESDFRRHGHDADPAYANVVLHVVFEAEGMVATSLPGGGRAPVLALPSALSRQRRSWDPLRAWAEPCATALGRLGGAACGETVDRLGEMRFRQKVHASRKRLEDDGDADEVLWSGLLEGLGYGGSRDAFRELSDCLPWHRLRRELASVPASLRRRSASKLLEAAMRRISVAEVCSGRPGNRVEVRLQGAAALAGRFTVNGPASSLLPLVAMPAKGAVAALLQALSVPKLIGRGRAIELALNTVLPLAGACSASPEEEAHVESVFAALPLPAQYGAVNHLRRALDGVRMSARRGQGMLYLLKQYCTQGGCGKCPLS
jgi:hypothetical protein